MFFAIALFAAIILVGVIASGACFQSSSSTDGKTRTGDTSARRPESLEGVLVAQLAAGEITQGQYRRSIEGLAARDEERHPLAVPPEIGPADA